MISLRIAFFNLNLASESFGPRRYSAGRTLAKHRRISRSSAAFLSDRSVGQNFSSR
jgi:hypothetical protein